MAELDPAALDACQGTWSSSFARDSLTLAFAALAETLVQEQLQRSESRTRYNQWLVRGAQSRVRSVRAGDAGLVVEERHLEGDGHYLLVARREPGEFVLTVEHAEFGVALGLMMTLNAEPPTLEGVCVAHFSGQALLATRWARALRSALCKRLLREREPLGLERWPGRFNERPSRAKC
jgi:hypothetical protein